MNILKYCKGKLRVSSNYSSSYRHTLVNVPVYDITYDDDFLGVIYSKTGETTLILPEISYVNNMLYTVVDEGLNAGTHNIAVEVRNGSTDTIHGSNSEIIQTDGGSMQIYNNGVDCWFIL